MKCPKIFKAILFIFTILIVMNLFTMLYHNRFIYKNTKKIPSAYMGVVPGASVQEYKPSWVLQKRLDAAILLYKEKKIQKILVSGDNLKKKYREADVMKNYLLRKSIHPKDIFMDHSGISTIDTLLNAKYMFNIKNMIVITQDFHLSRSLFVAHQLNIKAYGFPADSFIKTHKKLYYRVREFFAQYNAIWFLLFTSKQTKRHKKKFSIKGDGRLSWKK